MNPSQDYQRQPSQADRFLVGLATEVLQARALMGRMSDSELRILTAGLECVDPSTAEGRQAQALLALVGRELAQRESGS